MAIPFQIKDSEQDKERGIVPAKVSQATPVPQTENEQVIEESFVGRLFQELMGVYLRLSNGGRSSSGVERKRRPRSENEPSPPSQITPPSLMPDLIQHLNRHRLPLPFVTSPGLHNPIHSDQDLNPILPADDLTSKLALDTKMSIDFSLQTGQDLVGDTFDCPNSTCPAGTHDPENKEINLTLEFEFSILIPATILSLLSLALWKSRIS